MALALSGCIAWFFIVAYFAERLVVDGGLFGSDTIYSGSRSSPAMDLDCSITVIIRQNSLVACVVGWPRTPVCRLLTYLPTGVGHRPPAAG